MHEFAHQAQIMDTLQRGSDGLGLDIQALPVVVGSTVLQPCLSVSIRFHPNRPLVNMVALKRILIVAGIGNGSGSIARSSIARLAFDSLTNAFAL